MCSLTLPLLQNVSYHVVFVGLVIYLWPKTMSSFRTAHAMDGIVSLQNSYVEALSPNVMAFGYGSFGKELSLNEIMKANPYTKYPYMESHQTACFFIHKHTLRTSHVITQCDWSYLQARKLAPIKTGSFWHPDPGLPTSRNIRK